MKDGNAKQLDRLRKLLPKILARLEQLLSEDNGECLVTKAVREEVEYEKNRKA